MGLRSTWVWAAVALAALVLRLRDHHPPVGVVRHRNSPPADAQDRGARRRHQQFHRQQGLSEDQSAEKLRAAGVDVVAGYTSDRDDKLGNDAFAA
ncbi:MAG: hypothetical protein IPG77_00125, partial [Betaproteobacteria bacterium]|nr:hypothetical protein [Betaproteobacteria bacterium]